jgi:general secretion pathway protein M
MSALLRERWVGLGPREKRIVKIGGAIVGLALLVGLLIDPAIRNIGQIEKALPAQRQDLATVRAYAEEARRLNAASTGSNRAAITDLKQELEKSAERAGLGSGVKVAVTQQQATMTLTKISFTALSDWLGSVPRELGVQIIRAKIERAGADGLVSGELVFDGLGPKQ